MFYWSNTCVVAVLPEMILFDLVAYLVMTHGIGQVGQDLNLAEEQDFY